jgi:hypothetical protein
MPLTNKKPTTEKMWERLAEQMREEARKLPPGRARERMLSKARQLETASKLNGWLSSPGLRPPVDERPEQ